MNNRKREVHHYHHHEYSINFWATVLLVVGLLVIDNTISSIQKAKLEKMKLEKENKNNN